MGATLGRLGGHARRIVAAHARSIARSGQRRTDGGQYGELESEQIPATMANRPRACRPARSPARRQPRLRPRRSPARAAALAELEQQTLGHQRGAKDRGGGCQPPAIATPECRSGGSVGRTGGHGQDCQAGQHRVGSGAGRDQVRDDGRRQQRESCGGAPGQAAFTVGDPGARQPGRDEPGRQDQPDPGWRPRRGVDRPAGKAQRDAGSSTGEEPRQSSSWRRSSSLTSCASARPAVRFMTWPTRKP